MGTFTEDCCFNYERDNCKGKGCPCGCHAAVSALPSCGHEEEIERYRARSRAEDTARIRLNHERIALREWLEPLEAWASNVLGIVKERRIPSADVIADGEEIIAQARKALKH